MSVMPRQANEWRWYVMSPVPAVQPSAPPSMRPRPRVRAMDRWGGRGAGVVVWWGERHVQAALFSSKEHHTGEEATTVGCLYAHGKKARHRRPCREAGRCMPKREKCPPCRTTVVRHQPGTALHGCVVWGVALEAC